MLVSPETNCGTLELDNTQKIYPLSFARARIRSKAKCAQKGTEVLQLHKVDDLTTEQGFIKAIEAVRGERELPLYWAVILGTGGGQWQSLNRYMFTSNTQSPHTADTFQDWKL